MKVFYLTRLFSGLEKSFINKCWLPTGVPTIYRIIERLDTTYDANFVFTAKDSGSGYFSLWDESSDKVLSIDGLNHNVTIISGINFFPVCLGRKIRIILREIRQIILIIYKIYKFKPDILYCDHANIIIAAIFSRMQKHTSVVFRVMGVNNFMRTVISSNKFYHRIYSWAYRSPFSLVICTQDGSGVEKWIRKALLTDARTEILLNGTDALVPIKIVDSKLEKLPSNKIIIMFIGKLEIYKGCYEFVESILTLLNNEVLNIHALIIGSGTEKEKLLKLIHDANLSNFFTFIDSIPHAQIFYAYSVCDIYVSINHMGSLSNVNLEAIQSNKCMIISEPQEDKGIDKFTESLLGSSVISVPINKSDKLFNALLNLINSKSKREEMSRRVSKIKKNFIWSWSERVNAELDILDKLKG